MSLDCVRRLLVVDQNQDGGFLNGKHNISAEYILLLSQKEIITELRSLIRVKLVSFSWIIQVFAASVVLM